MAFTQVNGSNVWFEDQSLTHAVPTTSATDGAPHSSFDGFMVVVEANSGQTITGGGVLLYFYDPAVAAWVLLDSLSPATGARRASFSTVDLTGLLAVRPGARLCVVTNSLTVSSGTTARVWMLGGRYRGD